MTLLHLVVQPLRLQPVLKGLPGDADHVTDADRLERCRQELCANLFADSG